MSQTKEKIASLQTLRGLSIFAVFLVHTSLYEIVIVMAELKPTFNTGWLGVEFFFIISGFVVSMSLHRNGFQVGSFYVKRIFRLMPCMILAAAFGVAASLYLRSGAPAWPFETKNASDPWEQALLAIGGASSLVMWRHKPVVFSFQHMWSLSIEEQFYTSIGAICLILALLRRKRPKVVLSAMGIGALLLGLAIAAVRISNTSGPLPHVQARGLFAYLAEFKFDFLCAGVALYWAYDAFNLRFRQRTWLSVLLFAAAVGPFVWFGWLGFPHDNSSARIFARVGYPLAILSFSTAVILAASDISWTPRDSIAYRLFLYLGERSYLIYLFHIPLSAVGWMIIFRHFPRALQGGAAGYAIMLFLFTALSTLLVTEVLHRCVEAPLIRVGARLAKRLNKAQPSEPANMDEAPATLPMNPDTRRMAA